MFINIFTCKPLINEKGYLPMPCFPYSENLLHHNHIINHSVSVSIHYTVLEQWLYDVWYMYVHIVPISSPKANALDQKIECIMYNMNNHFVEIYLTW